MQRFSFSVILVFVAAIGGGRAYAQSYQQELSDSIKPSGTVDTGTTDQRMIQVAGSNAGTALKILTDGAGNLTTVPAAGAVADVNVMRTGPTPGTALAAPIDADTGAGTTNYLPVIVRTPGAAGTGLDGVAVRSTTEGITSTGNSLEVAIVAGQDGIAGGTGVTGANVPRVTLATDVALPTGANTIGAVDVRVGGGAATGNTGVVGASTQRVTLATDVALPTGANVIGALTANQSVNEAQINGVAPSMGNGISGVGVQRVTLASDSTGQVQLATGANTIGALTANQSVNVAQMNGVAVTMDSGVSGLGVQRVILATNQPVIPVSDNAGSLTVDSTQLPAALVGGRLDGNLGAVGGTATSTNSGAADAGTIRVVTATSSPVSATQSGLWTTNTSTRTATVGSGADADTNPPNTLTSVLVSCVTAACTLTLRTADAAPCVGGSPIEFKAPSGGSFFANFTEPPAFSALCIDSNADGNVSSFVVTTR